MVVELDIISHEFTSKISMNIPIGAKFLCYQLRLGGSEIHFQTSGYCWSFGGYTRIMSKINGAR